MENDEYGAAQALQDLGEGRAAAARRVVTPWWYHALFGVSLFAMVAGLSRGSDGLLVGLAVVAQGLLLLLYRRLTGLWLNTFHIAGLKRATVLALLFAYAVLAVGGMLEHGLGVPFSLVVAGVVMAVAYVLFWRWVERRLVELWRA